MDTAIRTASPTVTIDVYPAAPVDLRRRLREQPATTAASLLPGGMVLEESAHELVYRLALPGAFRLERDGDDVILTDDRGTTVRVVDGQLSLTIAK